MKWNWVTLVLLVASPLLAQELDRHEKKWAEQCVVALASQSPRVRASAARALGQLGVDAIPSVVKRCAVLKSNKSWEALAGALDSMGKTTAAGKLEALRSSWPTSAQKRLTGLLRQMSTAPAEGDPEIAAKVRKLLAKYDRAMSYSPQDAEILNVIRIGRPAIPALLAMLRQPSGQHLGFRQEAVCDALSGLAKEQDRAALTDLLLAGHLVVARCFTPLHGDKTLDTMITALEQGLCNHDLLTLLEGYSSSKRMAAALTQYIKRNGRSGFVAGSVAEFLGEIRAYDAVPVLEGLLPVRGGTQYRRGIGTGLSMLGSKKGIPILLDVFETSGRRSKWPRHGAGQTLNTIVGRRIYLGSLGDGSMDAGGNFVEAQRQFREWWKKHEATLKFDRSTGRWKG